jgi:peptidyl-prolyl cis-trans isomerase C
MHPIPSSVAAALLAATVAFGAHAQDKAAPKKADAKAAAPAAAAQPRLVVNGVTIPQSRVDLLNRELSANGQPDSPDRQRAIKEELISREVLVQAAQKRGLDKTPDTLAQLDAARQAVLVRALIEAEIRANPVSDADLQKTYDEFKRSMGENEFKVRHILVEKEDEAKAIIADLGKGGDFAKIAKDKSKDPGSKDNGGDLDWGPAARYVKPFADALMAMKKGQTSTAPVKTDFGFHVLRLDDVRPIQVPPFDEMKEQFRQRGQQQQVQKMMMDLRAKAKVEER